MNPYVELINKAKKKTARLIRDVDCVSCRISIMQRFHKYETLLKQIEVDYPKATTNEIKATVVNRLRHENEDYKKFSRLQNTTKAEYTKIFIKTMDSISVLYPWVADEVVRQINNKTKHHSINGINFYSLSERIQKSLSVNLSFTNNYIISRCFV